MKRVIYVEKLAPTIVGTGKTETCRAGWTFKVELILPSWEFFCLQENSIFASKAFMELEGVHPQQRR